jgi:peroxiredoxin
MQPCQIKAGNILLPKIYTDMLKHSFWLKQKRNLRGLKTGGLAPGQPAPDFDVVTPDGKQMKLSDLKGKVVYLGFWAGWCRQCIGEMIAEKKVKELIRNKPLEFVYVSIGNDSAAEQQIAKQYKIDGIFTVAKSGWESKEVGLYGVQGIPAYYLIDEEGNFALQSAPNPTRKVELVLAIEKLFK